MSAQDYKEVQAAMSGALLANKSDIGNTVGNTQRRRSTPAPKQATIQQVQNPEQAAQEAAARAEKEHAYSQKSVALKSCRVLLDNMNKTINEVVPLVKLKLADKSWAQLGFLDQVDTVANDLCKRQITLNLEFCSLKTLAPNAELPYILACSGRLIAEVEKADSEFKVFEKNHLNDWKKLTSQ